MDTKKSQKRAPNFLCEKCDFVTSKRSNYVRHLATDKHKWIHLDTKKEQKEPNNVFASGHENNVTERPFVCECGSIYKRSQGLSKHKKSCSFHETEVKMLTNLVLEVIQQNHAVSQYNQTLTTKLVELCSKTMAQSHHQHNTLIQNQSNTFNLNVFLNETCKDAMNINDFIDSLQLQLSDLERIGEVGFAEGISNIIVKHLKALDVTERPIHCADKKREIIYVKDEDKWERETDEKNKLRKAIRRIATKNQHLLSKFKEAHPGCNYSESQFSDQYSKIVIEAMRDNDADQQNKIIKNIAKEVVIVKK